jgi:hypothetical protein
VIPLRRLGVDLIAEGMAAGLERHDRARDAKPSGLLKDFPSNQPAPSEHWVPLSRGDFTAPADASPGEHWPPEPGPVG